MFLAIFENLDEFKGGEGFLKALGISLVAVVIVFLVLALIIGSIYLMKAFLYKKSETEATEESIPVVATKTSVEEVAKIPAELDDDMMVAALVATVDFHSETNQDARLVSIKRIG